jgi:polysaccharide biosynthesis protein PslH
MRILFLTSRFPYPPHRGDKLKIFNLIRYLSSKHEVFLISFTQRRRELEFLEELQKWCVGIKTVLLPPWHSLANCGVAIFGSDPFQVSYFRSAEMDILLHEEVKRIRPDVIHTHLIRMAPYTSQMRDIPRVLDLTDAVSLYLDRYRQMTNSKVRRWFLDVEYARMRSFEQSIAQFDKALVCSDVDRQFLAKNVPGASLDLLYNGIDLDTFTDDGSVRASNSRIIFTGNMSYFPNADGAEFLARQVFPIVKNRVPEAELYIVGQSPPRHVKGLESDKIHVTGFVDDIRVEYLKSAVAVSAVRFGAGTLNKVLEPLALGIPVVTTSVGVGGLGLVPGTDILVSDDTEEFAQHIVALLQNTNRRRTMGMLAREKVRSRFSWAEIGRTLEDYYVQVVTERSASHSAQISTGSR